jgi:Leucine-rich repeat (LRR) protein
MNEVEEIPDQLFRSNADLTILMFSHNQIQVLSRNSFIGLKSLNHLDLSNNLINDVQKGIFILYQ